MTLILQIAVGVALGIWLAVAGLMLSVKVFPDTWS